MIATTIALGLLVQLTPAEEAFRSCRSLDNDSRRLACFDKAVADLPLVAERRAAAAKKDAAPTVSNEPQLPVDVEVVDIRLRADGKALVTLSDGVTWRQLSGSRKLRSFDLRKAERATIKPAAFGSYRMTIEPLGRSFKVRRVE